MDIEKSNNELELTSTMGNVLSTSSKDEKNDTNDATPTSSTDANTSSTASQIVSDDPISSTSSDVVEQNKPKAMQNSVDVGQTASDEPDKSSSADHEADLLEMSISNVPTEKITEDVEDLVHDLESLLGESTDSFNVTVKRKEAKSPDVKEVISQLQTSVAKDQEHQSSDTSEEKSGNIIIESQQVVAEAIEKTIPKDQEPEPENAELTETTSVPETASHEASNASNEPQDPVEETSEVKSVTEDVEETPSDTVDTQEGIVSEPEQTNNRCEEIPAGSEVEIVEITEVAELKSTEGQEEVEGIVDDGEREKPVEVITNVPEIVIEPPEEGEPKVIAEEISIEEIESVEQPDEEGDRTAENDPVEVIDIPSEVVVQEESAIEVPSDEVHGQTTSIVLDSEEICSEPTEEVTEEATISEVRTEGRSETIESVTVDKSEEIVEEKLEVETEAVEEPSETTEDNTIPTLVEEIEDEVVEVPKPVDEETEVEEVSVSQETAESQEQTPAIEILETPNQEVPAKDEAEPEVEEVVEDSCGDMEKPPAEKLEEGKETTGELDETVEATVEILSCQVSSPPNVEPPCDVTKDIAEIKPSEDTEAEAATIELPCEANEVTEEITSCEETEAGTVELHSQADEVVEENKSGEEAEAVPAESPHEAAEVTEESKPCEETEAVTVELQCEIPETTIKTNSSEETEAITVDPPGEAVKSCEETSEDTEVPAVEEPCEAVEAIEPHEEVKLLVVESPTVEETESVTAKAPQETGEATDKIEPSEDDALLTSEPIEVIPSEEHDNLEVEPTLSEGEPVVQDVEDKVIVEEAPTTEEVPMEELAEEKEDNEAEITKIEEIEAASEEMVSEIPAAEASSDVAEVETAADAMDSEEICIEVPQKVTEEVSDEKSEDRPDKITDSTEIEGKKEGTEALENVQDSYDISSPGEAIIEAAIEDVVGPEPIVEAPEVSEEISETQTETTTAISITEVISIQEVSEETPIIDEVESVLVEETPVVEEPEETPTVCEEIAEEPCEIIEEIDEIAPCEETNDVTVESQETAENLEPIEVIPHLETEESSLNEEERADNEVPVSEAEEISPSEELVEDVEEYVMTVPAVNSDAEEEEAERKQEKVIEISDDESKPSDDSKVPNEGSGDYVQVLSSSGESDSEETVPVLALEPDESVPSPKAAIEDKDDVVETEEYKVQLVEEEALPEIDEILADQGQPDEAAASIDMQENLETILAVASLQSTEVEPVVEPQISEKERREMEALRKAVESITENAPVELEEEVDNVVEELIKEAEIPVGNELSESREEVVTIENNIEMVVNNEEVVTIVEDVDYSTEKTEQVESDTDQDVPELRIEDSEDAPEVEENIAEAKEQEQSPQSFSDTSENDRKEVLPDSSQVVLVNEEFVQAEPPKETKSRSNERSRRHKKSAGDNKFEELSINVDVPDREKPYSPKVTIKPIKVPDDEVSTTSNSDSEVGKGCLKMTITKQSDKMHSILKICDPETSEAAQEPDEPIPKLIIKPKMQQVEQQHSPKMSTRSSKQMYSPTSSTQRSGSPRITIKPVVKPQEKPETVGPLKIKLKPDDTSKKHNLKSVSPEDESPTVQTTRRVIIKPVVKPVEEPEQVHSPRITIKPIPKPDSEKETLPRVSIKPIKKQDDEELEERSNPKITIKPIVKPQELEVAQSAVEEEEVKERIVLKINKGNLPTPTKETKKREHPPDEEKLAKITVKFSKGGGHPHIVHNEESNKRPHEEQVVEKSKKQKTDGETMSTRSKHKDSAEITVETRSKHRETVSQGDLESPGHESTRSKHKDPLADSPVEAKKARFREAPSETPIYESTRSRHKDLDNDDPDISIIEAKIDSPIVISEDSRSQDSGSCVIVEDCKDPLSNIPMFEMRPEPKAMTPRQDSTGSAPSTPSTPTTPTPRKRGRPRKVPIVVREEFKEQEEPQPEPAPQEEPPKPVVESGRPKRSCRGQSARATLGIKPRKPRGGGRGRGSKRGMGSRAIPMKPESEPRLSKARLKLMQESAKQELVKAKEQPEDHERQPVLQCLLSNIEIKAPEPPEPEIIEIPSSPVPEPEPEPSPQAPVVVSPAPPSPKTIAVIDLSDADCVVVEDTETAGPSTATESTEIVMVDEETRMSADTNSRAQTPAKQVPADVVIEESQSSVQSTATTESGKAAASARPNKAPRLEVVQDPEGDVMSADQLAEYYWNGSGPYMLQEQVAQFLGIKSFKRKYPGIARRALDMRERDFIKEGGLASEHMCDLGLTAVNSADILDIMYSDFQEKYEEYCKHQRDRQAKDLINKQKALSLAASQEKNKADITEQAVQSAAQWNASFNKTRKEQRKACMDLQTLTVHYPKGKLKQIPKAKVGNYPVALVPGQFTDYYKEFTPTEINNLPLNTLCYDPVNIIPPEESDDSGSEGSDSDSDTSSSSSGSASDSSSGIEGCKLCKHSPKKATASK